MNFKVVASDVGSEIGRVLTLTIATPYVGRVFRVIHGGCFEIIDHEKDQRQLWLIKRISEAEYQSKRRNIQPRL